MTLKSSSSNNGAGNNGAGLLWQLTVKTLRRYIWLPILALLGFGLALPVLSALFCHHYEDIDWSNYWEYENMTEAEWTQWRSEYVADLQLMWQGCSIAVIMAGGLLVALVLFRYLQVRTQVDFYHSLPVRREQYFWSNVLAAVLMFAAPYLVAHLLNLAVMGVGGWLPYMDMGRYFGNMLFCLLAYLVMFSCGTLAVQLSGSMPGALKILVMSFGLCPLILATYTALGSVFFGSYTMMFSTLDNLLLRASAPEFVVWVSMLPAISLADWLTALILPAVLLGVSLALYKRRSSEAAGSTLAFGWQKIIFKYPLVLIGGLLMGLAFYGVSEGSWFWLYFGAAFGSIFLTVLMDIFIKSDFKAIKRAWPSAIISTVLVFVILACYQGDWLGYDRYVPQPDNLQAAYVNYSVLQNFVVQDYYYYYSNDYFDYWDFSQNAYISDSQMIKLTDPEILEALCGLIDSNLKSYGRYDSWYGYNGYYGSYSNCQVVWELESGKQVARYYWLPTQDSEGLELIEKIMNGADYKRSIIPEGADLNKVDFGTLDVYTWNGWAEANQEVKFASAEAQRQFLETVQREYGELSGEQLLYALPVCSLNLTFYDEKFENSYGYADYEGRRYREIMLHPDMTESLALLDAACGNHLLLSEDISNIIEVKQYSRRELTAAEAARAAGQPEAAEYYENMELAEVDYGEQQDRYWTHELTAVYKPETDGDKIREILGGCVMGNAMWSSGVWYSRMFDTYYEVTVRIVGDYDEDDKPIYNSTTVETYYPQPTRDMMSNYWARQNIVSY